MDQQSSRVKALTTGVEQAVQQLKIAELSQQLEQLQADSQKTDFWNDSTRAQDAMKQIASLESRVEPWRQLQQNINEITELLALKGDS